MASLCPMISCVPCVVSIVCMMCHVSVKSRKDLNELSCLDLAETNVILGLLSGALLPLFHCIHHYR